MLFSLIFGLIIGAVSVIFALQNIFPVTVTFLAWNLTASLAVIIVVSLFVGVIISSLLSIPGAIRSSLAISKLKKENKKLSDDLAVAQRSSVVTQTITSTPTNATEPSV